MKRLTPAQFALADYLVHTNKENFVVATSQYFMNTATENPDVYSYAPTVLGLVKRGLIEADYGWRYFDVKIVDYSGLVILVHKQYEEDES